MARTKKMEMVKEDAVKEVAEEKVKEAKIPYIEVNLIGSPAERNGNHTVYFAEGYVEFKEGKATVKKEVAEILRELGAVK